MVSRFQFRSVRKFNVNGGKFLRRGKERDEEPDEETRLKENEESRKIHKDFRNESESLSNDASTPRTDLLIMRWFQFPNYFHPNSNK